MYIKFDFLQVPNLILNSPVRFAHKLCTVNNIQWLSYSSKCSHVSSKLSSWDHSIPKLTKIHMVKWMIQTVSSLPRQKFRRSHRDTDGAADCIDLLRRRGLRRWLVELGWVKLGLL